MLNVDETNKNWFFGDKSKNAIGIDFYTIVPKTLKIPPKSNFHPKKIRRSCTQATGVNGIVAEIKTEKS